MQEKFPLVSIIIPVYNGSDFLESAIKSALNQAYKNIEIIVVNDGSSDDGQTKRIALSYQDRIRYLEKENGGVSSAFNLGIWEMKGDYFSWLSHDDEYYPEKTHIQIEAIIKSGLDKTIIFSNTDYIDKDSMLLPSKSRIKDVKPSVIQFQMLTVRPLINGNTVLVPRECFDKVGFFDESLKTSQDYDMWFRLAEYFPFYFINQPLVKTRIHKSQGSKKINTFISESCSAKIKMLNSISEQKLLFQSGERDFKKLYFKLLVRYIRNGGEKNGWPTSYIITKIFSKCEFFGVLMSKLISMNLTRRFTKFLFGKSRFISEK